MQPLTTRVYAVLLAGAFLAPPEAWGKEDVLKEVVTVNHQNVVRALAFTPDGKMAVSASFDTTIRAWDTATGKVRHQWITRGMNSAVAISPDGKSVAGGNARGELYLWELASGKERFHHTTGQENVYCVTFAPDGRTLATANHASTVTIWDAATGKALRHCFGHDRRVWGVAFSPDGRTLASSGEDATVRLWDPRSGKELRRFNGHNSHVCTLAFSPDGRYLATGSFDGEIRIWEVLTGSTVLRLSTPLTHYVSFSPDGKTLASADKQNAIQLWDLSSGKRLHRATVHTAPVLAVVFAPDGRRLASGSEDASARLWNVRLKIPVTKEEELSRKELDELWSALGGEDAEGAYRAGLALAAAPKSTLPLLERRLSAVAPPNPQERKERDGRIAQLIRDLDAPRFTVREKAMEELEKLGRAAIPALEKAQDNAASLEVLTRAAVLLDRLQGKGSLAVRGARAVAVLEHIGGEAAQKLLKKLAGGDPEAALTQEAKAALTRLIHR